MNVIGIVREAQACNDLVDPVISECAPLVENLQDAITQDLAVIAAMCGLEDGPSKPELFTAAGIFGLALRQDGRETLRTLECFAGTAELESILKDAEFMRNLVGEVREKNITSLLIPEILRTVIDAQLEEMNKLEAEIARLKHESLPRRRETRNAEKIADAYYRYARALIEEVGGSPTVREHALKIIHGAIYGDPDPEAIHILIHQQPVEEIQSSTESQQHSAAPSKDDLEAAQAELTSLVGMQNIKQEVNGLTNFLKIERLRMERGQAKTSISLHAVFLGPPGTGKTTVARLVGKIYYHLGFLAKGHVIDTDRAGMVAGYVGQTSLKVDELVKSALDGVLFIDEAYALTPEGAGQDYGREAIDILLKRMEDYRNRLVVIIAGYPDEMARFLDSNSGVKSRFNRFFQFDHYEPIELLEIFEGGFCKKAGFTLTPQARVKVSQLFEKLYASKDRSFGNARLARNIFERAVQDQANRIASVSPITNDVLSTIAEEDIDASRYLRQSSLNSRRLGF